ncbi:MAG: hypothetical protein KDJ48_11315, partial [Nitratireductor sp.]|nr:hypothetical protein [Nitratireductor sp.]
TNPIELDPGAYGCLVSQHVHPHLACPARNYILFDYPVLISSAAARNRVPHRNGACHEIAEDSLRLCPK